MNRFYDPTTVTDADGEDLLRPEDPGYFPPEDEDENDEQIITCARCSHVIGEECSIGLKDAEGPGRHWCECCYPP